MRSFQSPLRWFLLVISMMTCAATARPALAQSSGQAAGQGTEPVRTWWLPPNVFSESADIDTLFYGILWLTCAVCVGVFIALIAFLIKYRHQPGRHARFIHGNNKLETVWTLIPTVILALIAAVSQTSWARMKKPPVTPVAQALPDDQIAEVVELRVVGIQFKWYFQYPGRDGKLGELKRELKKVSPNFDELIGLDRSGDGKDDIVTPVMYVPVNRPVYIHLTSVDVLHSFFLPEFRIKQDAVPGLEPKVWFNANKTSAEINGVDGRGSPRPFDIVCAELCGQGHYTMRGELYVVNDEQFIEWRKGEYEFLGFGTEGEGGDDAGY